MELAGLAGNLTDVLEKVTGLLLELFLALTLISFIIVGLKSVFGDWKAERRIPGALLLSAAAVFMLALRYIMGKAGNNSGSLFSLGINAPMLSAALCAAGIAASAEYFIVISLGKRWRYRKRCSAVFGLCGTVADSGILGFEHVKEPFLGYRYRWNNRNYIAEPHRIPKMRRNQVGEKTELMIDPVCPEFFLTAAEMKLTMFLPLGAGAAGICLLIANIAVLRAGG